MLFDLNTGRRNVSGSFLHIPTFRVFETLEALFCCPIVLEANLGRSFEIVERVLLTSDLKTHSRRLKLFDFLLSSGH